MRLAISPALCLPTCIRGTQHGAGLSLLSLSATSAELDCVLACPEGIGPILHAGDMLFVAGVPVQVPLLQHDLSIAPFIKHRPHMSLQHAVSAGCDRSTEGCS